MVVLATIDDPAVIRRVGSPGAKQCTAREAVSWLHTFTNYGVITTSVASGGVLAGGVR